MMRSVERLTLYMTTMVHVRRASVDACNLDKPRLDDEGRPASKALQVVDCGALYQSGIRCR